MQQVNLGMIGGGTVGSGVFHALQLNGGLLASRTGVKVNVRKIAVKAVDEPRPYRIPEAMMTTDWEGVVNDPQVDIVAELAGGTGIARTMILTALKLGKPVITANKALLSAHGEELFAAANDHGTNLYYEASVCGGIPIIKSVREGFVGNRITHLYGIVNGTCNYILTRMKLEGIEFDQVLKDAQAQGYAEADPSLDVDGHDALHKIGILASLAHGFWVKPEKIHFEGIRSITQTDIRFANQLGYTVKLLGIIKSAEGEGSKGEGRATKGEAFAGSLTKEKRSRSIGSALQDASATKARNGARVQVTVYPTLVPNTHVLSSINHVFNAVFVRGDVVGDTLFYGRGAGSDATASAVLSDLADASLDLKFETKHRLPPFVPHEKDGAVLPIDEVVSRYFVRLNVVDMPGVLAQVSNILGNASIGISSVIQPQGHEGKSVPLILMLHDAPNGAVSRALKKIGELPVVKAAPVMIRVENFE
ncbi:MAG: homoserine dehydrogenase [Verrucomicrobia bacterium]|nr:MAG: homoserine dehydrogenase [Verrucomicrobiota bacterium]